MLTKRERLKIVLPFLLLGPLVAGLMAGLALLAASADSLLIHMGTVLWFVLLAYPVGVIPAIIAGGLMQWLIVWTMRRSISLSKAKWFLAGAFAGALGSLSLIIFMIEFIIQDFRNGKSLGGLSIPLVLGAMAGGTSTMVALRKLQNNKGGAP